MKVFLLARAGLLLGESNFLLATGEELALLVSMQFARYPAGPFLHADPFLLKEGKWRGESGGIRVEPLLLMDGK